MQDFSASLTVSTADYLLDTLPWGVLVLGPGGTIVRLNQQAAAWWGQAPAAVLGQPLAQAGAGQLPAPAYAALGQAAAGQPLQSDFWLPQAGRWVALSSAPQASGETVVYWHDSTAQRQGEQQYQALADNVPAVVTRWDTDLRLCYASADFALKIGRPLPALLGRTLGEMGLPADLSVPYMVALRRVLATGQPQDHYHSLPTPGGQGLCHSRLVPELRHGGVATVLGIAHEHTEETLRLATAADAFRLRLADALGPLTQPGAMQEAVTHLARQHFGADRCCYCEIAEGQAIIRHDAAAPGLPSVVGTYQLADFAPLQAAIEAGWPYAVRDMHQADAAEDSLRQLCVALQVIACLAGPVIKYRQLVGVLCLTQAVPRAWTAAETALAAEVAERTWAAVAQDQAQEALRRSEARQAFLLQLSDALRPLATAAEMQATAARLLGQHLGADQVYYDDNEGNAGSTKEGSAAVVTYAWYQAGALGYLSMPWLLGGHPWVCLDVDTDPALPDAQRADYRARGIGAAVAVPLLRHGKLAAALVASQRIPRAWTPLEVTLVAETLSRTWAAVEHARAAQALARSEAKYHALFESIDEGFTTIEVIFDEAGRAVDYRMLEMNRAHEKMSGVPRTMVGRRVRELLPDIEEDLLRRLGKIVLTGEPMRYEQHVRALGRWFDVYASRVGGSGSRVLASVFNDITDRKRREQNLAFLADLHADFAPLLSAEQLMARVGEQVAAYLDLSRFHLAVVDPAADHLDIVFDWQPIAGHLPAVLGTHRISDYVTATGRRHFEAGRALVTSGLGLGPLLSTPPEVLAELGYGSFVDVPRLSGGQWRFMLTAARAAPGEWRPDEVELLEQLATRLYARLERAQAETALQAAHTQLVGVLENTHDAFYSLDAQSRFTYINHRAAQLWGRAPGTLIGQSFWQAFPQAVGSEAYHQHQQVLQTRQPTHFEVVSPVLGTWIEVSIYPGQDGGLSVFFRDITARKQAEARQAFWLRLSEALRPLQDPAAIQQAAMATLGPHLGLSRAYYTEILPDGDTIITRSGYCHGVPAVVGPHRLSDFGPALRQTLLAGTTVVVHDVLREPAPPAAAQPTFAALQLRAAVGVPLVKAGRLLGVLVASQATPRQWQADEITLLEEVAEHTWAAVERATAEAARRASEATLAAVFEALPVGVGLTNAQGELTLSNHRLHQYLPTGVLPSLDDTQYARWRAYDAEGRPLPRTELPGARARRGEKVAPGMEMQYTPATGPEVWTQVLAVPLADYAGHLVVIIDIDAQKRTEQALRQSEEQFRLFLTTSSDTLYKMSPDWQQMLTLEGKNFLADTNAPSTSWVEKYIPFEDQAAVWATIHAAIAGRHTFELEHRVRRADGAVAWAYSRAVPVLDARGEVVEWFGAATDITTRRQAEQQLAEFSAQLERQVAERTHELQASRDLLRSVLDTSLISMSVLRAVRDEVGAVQDFRLELVNQELERETGRRDLVGRLYAQEYPGIRTVGIFDLMLRALATGEPQGMEYYYQHEGFDRWFACQFIKLGDGIVATNLDITERRMAEQERIRNLRLLEQAEALAGLGSWDYDLATGTMRWSEGMYQLSGQPPGSAVAPSWYQAAAVAADRRRAAQLVQRLATGAGDFDETLRLHGPGGDVKTVRLKGVVLYTKPGQAGRVLGVALDLSELQRLEAENLRLRLEQQHALFEAVQQAQEEERRRMAESLHNGIGQILYATRLQLDLLPLLPGQPAYREAARLLGEAIRQTRSLSHELTPALLEEFGLEKTLANICSTLSSPALRWHCHLVFEDAPSLPASLQLAVYRLTQELVQNVLKHAQASQATLEVEVLPAWVVLRVEDNGRGFDPSRTSDGLGLRSLRSRAALLGGHVQLITAPGQGTQCQVRLPLPPAAG